MLVSLGPDDSSESTKVGTGSRKEARGGSISFVDLIRKKTQDMSFNELVAALGLLLEAHNPGKVIITFSNFFVRAYLATSTLMLIQPRFYRIHWDLFMRWQMY